LRAHAWRLRFLVAAVCAGLAAATAVHALTPAPERGVEVLVAARTLAAGTRLTAADLRVVTLPAGPAGAVASARARAALVGGTTAVPVPAGLPLVPELLAGSDLQGPPGTVVTAVRLADSAVAPLLSPGDRVDLLAVPAEGGPGVRVAHRALVLPSPPTSTGGGLFGAIGADSAPLLVAVLPDEAVALAGAVTSQVLFAVVVP